MDTQFYITYNLKTSKGPESFAKFFIGNNRQEAYHIFQKLKGTDTVNENNMLFVDFMEINQGLPVNLKMITCSLNQLGENCKIITKELFRLSNLEGKI